MKPTISVEQPPPTPGFRAVGNGRPGVVIMTKRFYSKTDTELQLDIVDQALTQLATPGEIKKLLESQGHKVTYGRVKNLSERIRKRWAEQEAASRSGWRTAQIKRVRNDAMNARKEKNYTATYRFESLLADLQGTREPLKISIDVRHTEALTLVLGTMDARQLEGLANEYDSNVKAATEYRALLEAPKTDEKTGTGG